MDEKALRALMQQALDRLISDIGSIRTGRATPALVEGIEVLVYGGAQKMRVMELASITAPDPQSIVIDPWDKSIIGDMRKGIEAANVGFNPRIDGQILRISLPPLTREDREKYVKLMSSKLEVGRVSLRQVRSDAMKEIKRAYEEKKITEDEKFTKEKKVQEITDEYVAKVEAAGEKKKQELLQV